MTTCPWRVRRLTGDRFRDRPRAGVADCSPSDPANIIDGADDRGSLLTLGPSLGLSADEITRIRKVSGHVGCFEPRPQVASGALFLSGDLVLTAAHTFFAPDGKPAGKCFFRPQTPGSDWMPLKTDAANARFGARPPRAGSNNDWALVRLATPIVDASRSRRRTRRRKPATR